MSELPKIWRTLNTKLQVPRFTLRELFLLTLIAAMGLAWWAEHSKVTSLRRQLGHATQALPGAWMRD